MLSPTDQPQAAAKRRSTDSPTLWLSLALGSVLIHLVLFILASLVLTRTANVELDLEPIAVEFVEPKAAARQAAAPSRAIATRPGAPSSTISSETQVQPSRARSQSSVTPPVEQPFIPQPARRTRSPRRTQSRFSPSSNSPQQPKLSTNPTPFQPTSPANLRSQPPSLPNQAQGQPESGTNPSQNASPGSVSHPGNRASGTTESQQPAEGERISQLPQGESVSVTVSKSDQPSVDVHTQPAQPSYLKKDVSISYSSALAHQTIRLQATLVIDQNGVMLSPGEPTLRSSGVAIDPETLKEIVRQIFQQWQFKPALDVSDGKLLAPKLSNLMIEVEVQLP